MDATKAKQANDMLTKLIRRKALDWCDNAIKAMESQVAELKRRRAELETCELAKVAEQVSWAVNHTAGLQGHLRLDLAVTLASEAGRQALRNDLASHEEA